jgi:lysophospholipase L1-like esterase
MRKNPAVKFLLVLMVLVTVAYYGLRFYRSWRSGKIIAQTLAGEHWTQRMNEFNSQPDTSMREIVFLGNSLTEGFDLSVFSNKSMLNRGIAGDFTEGVLKRLGEVTERKPDKIFLMIGINDIIEKVPIDDICANYEKIIQQVQQQAPVTKLYIQSALPVHLYPSSEAMNDSTKLYIESWLTATEDVNNVVKEYNKRLEQLSGKYKVPFINLYPQFLEGDALKASLTYDGIHLTGEAYAIWMQQVKRYVEE